jgi:hypothetical protein
MALPTFTAGMKLRASDLAALVSAMNAATVRAVDATSRTTTSTSFTTTLSPANILGVTFTAPQSGKIGIFWSTSSSNGSSPNVAQTSPSVRTGSTIGSGTVVQASGAALATTSIANSRVGNFTEVTGLTAGNTYNVALEHRAFSAGTATFLEREVTVVPLLN